MHLLPFMARALREARRYGPHLALMLNFGLAWTPLALVTPLPVKLIVDTLLGNQSAAWLMLITAMATEPCPLCSSLPHRQTALREVDYLFRGRQTPGGGRPGT